MAYYKDAASWKATWPMNDTVTTTKADVLEQVHLSFEDALQSEREEYWYEGHCASLTYLTGLYRHSGGSFTVAPQAPLFARTRKERLTVQGRNASGALGDDADGEYDGAAMAIDEEDADLNYVAAGKTLRRTRSISHDIGESHEELAFPGPKLYGPSENMDTDAQQHAVMAEEDAISSGMGSASDPLNKSTSSKPPDRENQQYSDDDSFHRVTDFAIVRRHVQRVVVCVVEIKPQVWTPKTLLSEDEERLSALGQVDAMMPQVVQQVQFAFHEQPSQDCMWALSIVGRWCAFHQFERNKTPPLDLDDIHARGYRPAMQAQGKFQPAATRISIGMADVVPVLADDNQDYHPKFKSAWLKFMTWACTMQLRVGE